MFVRFFLGGIFTIDDGEPRKVDDPEYKSLLQAFAKGYVPEPWARGAKEIDLHVIQVDMVHEEYVKKKKNQDDQQQQHQLQEENVDEDAILQQVIKESLELHQKNQAKKEEEETQKSAPLPTIVQEEVKVPFIYTCDTSKPFTNIQIKFHDGTKQVLKLNLSDTLDILYKLVASCAQAPQGNFHLVVPPAKILDNQNMTVQDAGISNGSLFVRKL